MFIYFFASLFLLFLAALLVWRGATWYKANKIPNWARWSYYALAIAFSIGSMYVIFKGFNSP
jgi:high-affinity Fe2+/Pb2+ permease